MSGKFEYGIVKFFNRSRGYGFMSVTDESGRRTGEEMYFNIKQGHLVNTHDWREQPYIGARHGESYKTCLGDRVIEVSSPRPGEMLMFIRGGKPSRPFAAKWVYATSWNRQKAMIARLPSCRVVRVSNDEVTEVLWTSKSGGSASIVEMSKQFPRSPDGSDELSRSYAGREGDNYPCYGLRIEVFINSNHDRGPKRWLPSYFDIRAPFGTQF